MDAIFKGIFDNELTQVIEVGDFLLCLGVSLVLGLIMAVAYMWRNEHTKSFLVTLALLPTVVCVVIMMVNGNIGVPYTLEQRSTSVCLARILSSKVTRKSPQTLS